MATRQLTTRQVVNLASDPSGGTPGEIYYNTSSNSFKYYNGAAWVTISGGGDALPSQTGNAGNYLTTNGTTASWGSITEDVQDIVGGMVSGNTESGISVTYDDTNGKLDFDVNDPTITLTGDITGSATMTNLGNVSISTTIAANSVELGTDTTGQYIASVSGTTNQVNVSGSGTESITLTLSTPQDIHSGASPTFAGATLDSVRVGITAANEIDTSSGNLIIDSAGGTVTVDDNLTVSGNLTVNGTTTTVNSTTVTVDDPIITLGGDTAPSSDDGKDRGIEFRYYDTQARLGFMGYNDSTGEFTLLLNATNTNEIFSGTKATLNAHISGSNINAGTVSATYIDSAIARLASPTFTGTVTAATLSLTTADTATAASHYFVETASDGVVRPKTLANVRTEIVTTAAVNSAAATTVGTITSGVWQGSSISTTYTDAKVTSVNGSTGAVTGLATTAGNLSQFAATTSAQLKGVISDETGSGSLVFATSPTLVTPNIGSATGTSLFVSGTFNSGANGKGGLTAKAYLQGASIANAVSHLALDTPSTAQGERSGMSFYSTFQSTADNGSRRTADILAGFNGGAWGNEYLAFHVGLGGSANDAQSLTTERLRVSKDSILSTVPFIAPAATTSITSIRLPHGTAPSAPTNGDVWTTTSGLFARINSTTIGPFGQGNQYYQTTAPSSPAIGDIWVDSDETVSTLNSNDFATKTYTQQTFDDRYMVTSFLFAGM